MTKRIGTFLTFSRFPNLLTLPGDILIGIAWTGGITDLPVLLIAGSVLAYLFGVWLNDITDYAYDQKYRPERLLPSGKITVSLATKAMMGALVTSGALFLVSVNFTGFVLLASIVSYNLWAKKHRTTAAINMGLCRALNIGLGMHAFFLDGIYDAWSFLPAGFAFLYFAGITSFARGEAHIPGRAETIGKLLSMWIIFQALLLTLQGRIEWAGFILLAYPLNLLLSHYSARS